MEESTNSPRTHPASGGLIKLQAHLANSTTWLGPTWAIVCGIIASGPIDWQSKNWLRIGLLILLVDGGWGTLWAALGNTDWAASLSQWRTWEFGEKTLSLPYTLPDTPSDRVLRWLGLFRAWWRHLFWLDCGAALSAIVIAAPVTALLATVLGPQFLLLSLGALAVMQMGLITSGGHGDAIPEWDGLLVVAFPWLAGHVAFAPPTTHSLALALAFALAWGTSWRVTNPWARATAVGSQLLAASLLLVQQHPLVAGTIVLLSIPQIALLPWVKRGRTVKWYTRHTRVWLMAAMLLAAWAL